jgi:hypothetical protein
MNVRRMIGAFLFLSVTCLTACASRSVPADPPHVAPTKPAACPGVCVTLTDNKIESSRVTFNVGHAAYFVVTNKGKAPTNFVIMTEPQGPNPAGSYNRILYITSATPPGSSRSFTYAFPIIAPQSTVEFASDLVDPGDPVVQLPIQVDLG